jgi:exopolysaccharide biosynthesis predicted pyruvyltransferase EpsI
LPQSINYRDVSKVDRVAKLIASHRDFHLMVRDDSSLKFAQENF